MFGTGSGKYCCKARKKAAKAEGLPPPKPAAVPAVEAEGDDDKDPITKAIAKIAALSPGETILVKGLPKPVREPDPEIVDEPPMPAPAVIGEGASTPEILKAAEEVFSGSPGNKEKPSGEESATDKD